MSASAHRFCPLRSKKPKGRIDVRRCIAAGLRFGRENGKNRYLEAWNNKYV